MKDRINIKFLNMRIKRKGIRFLFLMLMRETLRIGFLNHASFYSKGFIWMYNK